jgi:cation transport regulator ChaC
MKHRIGILAFGSLIDNPGKEINELEIERINCITPFKIEFARISSSRDKAPTLVPVEENSKGKKTNATIIVIDENIKLDEAKSILWRRECHKTDRNEKFVERKKPTSKNVLVLELENFCEVEKVIYTSFLKQDEYQNLTPEKLADYAIESILSKAGVEKKDGIRYLQSTKKYGIITENSQEYEKQILLKTNTASLEEAIEKLDKQNK